MGRVLWSRSAGWETLVGLLFVVTGQSRGEVISRRLNTILCPLIKI